MFGGTYLENPPLSPLLTGEANAKNLGSKTPFPRPKIGKPLSPLRFAPRFVKTLKIRERANFAWVPLCNDFENSSPQHYLQGPPGGHSIAGRLLEAAGDIGGMRNSRMLRTTTGNSGGKAKNDPLFRNAFHCTARLNGTMTKAGQRPSIPFISVQDFPCAIQ